MLRPQPSHRQPNLFTADNPPVPIAASERTTLLLLVSVLLARRRWPSSLRLRQATKITPDHLARGAFADAACMRLAT